MNRSPHFGIILSQIYLCFPFVISSSHIFVCVWMRIIIFFEYYCVAVLKRKMVAVKVVVNLKGIIPCICKTLASLLFPSGSVTDAKGKNMDGFIIIFKIFLYVPGRYQLCMKILFLKNNMKKIPLHSTLEFGFFGKASFSLPQYATTITAVFFICAPLQP